MFVASAKYSLLRGRAPVELLESNRDNLDGEKCHHLESDGLPEIKISHIFALAPIATGTSSNLSAPVASP